MSVLQFQDVVATAIPQVVEESVHITVSQLNAEIEDVQCASQIVKKLWEVV